MANKTNSSSNFFETLVEAQQQAFDTMVENTKKFTNGNAMANETLEKGTEYFKKSVDAAKETFDKMNAQTSTVESQVKQSTQKMTDYFTNWKNQQIEWANKMQEMNQSLLKNMMNPSAMQNNWSNMQNMWNMSADNKNMFDMSNMMNQMNPANMQSQMEKGMEQMKSFWNQFQTIMNDNYSSFSKNLQNGTLADTYKGMFNMSEGFSKFYEMWMPMLTSMQNKTFNMDMFSKNMNMGQYKEFMDKYMSFMPQTSQDYMHQMQSMMTEAVKQSSASAQDMAKSWKENMNSMMPGVMGNPYTNMLNAYNHTYGQMMNAMSPFSKMITPTNDTKSMQEWSKIMNDMTIYNIKNAELQHMVYETGLSVMEKIAESTMHKIENGEEVNSMMKLYQDYLSTSDKMFVDLFETDEYSKLMSEVSVMKMQIKKAVETQMEKAFVNMPIATRSEMDEVYQTIYDLKKMVRSLESKLHNMPAEKSHKAATHTEETAAPKATAAAPKVTKPATAKPAAAKPATKKTAKRK